VKKKISAPLGKIRILCVLNPMKPKALQVATRLIHEEVVGDMEMVVSRSFPPTDEQIRSCDGLLTLGGDGTLLGMVSRAHQHRKWLGGINCGQLGFLSAFTPESFLDAFNPSSPKSFFWEKRGLICVCANGFPALVVLNDVVVKSADQRMITLELCLGRGIKIKNLRCDGILFSTPTGSTAYNFSANGPMVESTTRAWIATPICSHSSLHRSLILDEKTVVRVRGDSPVEIFTDGVRTDWKLPLELSFGETLDLLLPEDYHSFRIFRRKRI
jgi:NAD+ kinase